MNYDSAHMLIFGLGSLIAGSFALLHSPEQGIAVVAGAVLGLVNYQGLYSGATRFFEAAQFGAARSWTWLLLAVFRLGFVGAALVLLLKLGLQPLGLVAGLSVPAFAQVLRSSYRAFVQASEARS